MLSTEIVLDRRTRSVPHARAHIVGALRAWGSNSQTVDDAALLVSELVDNAVKHTGGSRIAVRLIRDGDRVHCRVLDESPSPPRSRASQRTVHTVMPLSQGVEPCDGEQPLAENGRGLLLVEAIASRWGSHPDTHTGWSRKAVWFELHDPHAQPGDEDVTPHGEGRLPVRRTGSVPPCTTRTETDPDTLRRVLHALRQLR